MSVGGAPGGLREALRPKRVPRSAASDRCCQEGEVGRRGEAAPVGSCLGSWSWEQGRVRALSGRARWAGRVGAGRATMAGEGSGEAAG